MSTPPQHDPSLLIDLVCRKSQAVRTKSGQREITAKTQEARGRRTAEQLGLTVRYVWEEVGSASRFRRSKKVPKQELALKALEAGEIGAVWVFRLDRWTRRGAGAVLKIIEPQDGRPRRLLVDNGDPDNPGISLDSTNPRDRSELVRRAEDAREETEVLSLRVRSTKAFQRDNGEWISGRAPYGLRAIAITAEDDEGDKIEERKLTRDLETSAGIPNEPQITRYDIARMIIHDLPMSGMTNRAIAQHLNERGVPSPNGAQWGDKTVRDMISNPAYAGWQVTGRQEYKAKRLLYRNSAGEKVSVMDGPPILTEVEWNEVQVAAKGRVPGWGKGTGAIHLLTDLLKCSGCGSPMSWQGRGYICGKSRKGWQCPAPAYVQDDTAENYIHRLWSQRLTALAHDNDDLLAIVADRWRVRQAPEASADEQAAHAALMNAEDALSQLWKDRRAGLYTGPSEAFFAPALQETNASVVAARQTIEALRGPGPVDITFLLEPAEQREAWESADAPLKRDLLRLAIRSVKVHKATHQGQRFDGAKRMEVTWHDE